MDRVLRGQENFPMWRRVDSCDQARDMLDVLEEEGFVSFQFKFFYTFLQDYVGRAY